MKTETTTSEGLSEITALAAFVRGPLALEIIEYRYHVSLINQGVGLDAVALFGAVPMSITAAWLAR